MNEAAAEARRAYQRAWREKNRDHIRAYTKEWRANNPDKIRASNSRYWEKKAAEAGEAKEPATA